MHGGDNDTWGEGPSPELSGEQWEQPEADPEAPRYARHGVIGSGGMGVVYAARDRILQREVALKVAHDPALGRRMAQEAYITARLEHPGIVAIYDVGEAPDGRPWYAMRLIRGRSLRERLREAADLEERLELLRHVLSASEAVAYAHSMGIVHRDLKTANILVGEFGETQVADWGLARPFADDGGGWLLPDLTYDGAIVGTPATMSPEQARGEGVDPRSDVWSLGLVLFELLSGRPAFVGDSGEALLAAVRAGVVPELEARAPGSPPELVAIAQKALQRDPAQRYDDAGQLARDLERFLTGRRVQAHDYTPTELLLRTLQLWRLPLVVAAVCLLAATAAVAVVSAETAQQRNRAREALDVAARHLEDALVQQAGAAVHADARAEAELLAAHALRSGERPEARGVLAAFSSEQRPRRVLQRPLPPGCGDSARFSLDGALLACPTQDTLTVWDWRTGARIWSRTIATANLLWDRRGQVIIRDTDGRLLLFGPSGQLVLSTPLATSGVNGVLGSHDELFISDRQRVTRIDLLTGAITHMPACVSASNRLVPGPGPLLRRCDDALQIRRYGPDGAPEGTWDIEGVPSWSTVSRQGGRLYAGRFDGTVEMFDLLTGTEKRTSFGGTVLEVLPLPDTALVLVRGERGGPRIWDTTQGAWLGRLPGEAVRLASGDSPGEVIVLEGDRISLWQVPITPRPWALPVGAGVSMVDFSPRGGTLLWANGSGDIGVVSLDDGVELARTAWQGGVVKGLTMTSDERLLFASGMNAPGGKVLSTETWTPRTTVLPETGFTFRRVGGLAGGPVWGLTYRAGSGVWDPETGALLLSLGADDFFEGASSPGQERAALLSTGGGVWELRAEPLGLRSLGRAPDSRAVDISADGQTVVLGMERAVCRLDLTTGAPTGCHPVSGRVLDVALSPDDRTVAVSTLAGHIALHDLETGALRALLQGHTAQVPSVAFHPDGTLLASGSWDGHVRLWDLSKLDADPDALIASLEDTWGMDLSAALSTHP